MTPDDGIRCDDNDGQPSGVRFDMLEELGAPTEHSDGYARFAARIGRVGVFRYLNCDGSIRRELRPPDEVFAPAALASFRGIPVLDEHPRDEKGRKILIDAKSVRGLIRGSVGDDVRRGSDSKHIEAGIIVHDADLRGKMERGKKRISPAYRTNKIDLTPGRWNGREYGPHVTEGEEYDLVQRDLKGNHVAVVWAGRQGSTVGARVDDLDDDAAVMLGKEGSEEPRPPKEEPKVDLENIRLDDGIDIPVAKTHAQILQAHLTKTKERLDDLEASVATLTKERDTITGERDAEKADHEKLKAERTDDAIEALVEERAVLVAAAKKIGLKDEDLKGLGAMAIRRAVVKHEYPDDAERLDDASDDNITGRYEVITRRAEDKPHDSLEATRQAAEAARGARARGERADSEDPEAGAKAIEDRWSKLAADADKAARA